MCKSGVCMLLFLLLAAALVVAFQSAAFASPGQTEKQLIAWGKANPSLHHFKGAMDQNTGGTLYTADFAVEGFTASFSSEPVDGVVPHEWVNGPPDKNIARMPFSAICTKVLARVYGDAVGADCKSAQRVPARIVVAKGKLFGYALSAEAVAVFRLSDLPEVLKNARACSAFDCAGD